MKKLLLLLMILPIVGSANTLESRLGTVTGGGGATAGYYLGSEGGGGTAGHHIGIEGEGTTGKLLGTDTGAGNTGRSTGIDTGGGLTRTVLRVEVGSVRALSPQELRRGIDTGTGGPGIQSGLAKYALDFSNIEEITLKDGSVVKVEDIKEKLGNDWDL